MSRVAPRPRATTAPVPHEWPTATICGTSTERQQCLIHTHTEYCIEVSVGLRSVKVHRRYRDFVALHAALVECGCLEALPRLPKKVLLLTLTSSFVARRSMLLQQYLHQLLDALYGRAQPPQCLLDFLGLYESCKSQFCGEHRHAPENAFSEEAPRRAASSPASGGSCAQESVAWVSIASDDCDTNNSTLIWAFSCAEKSVVLGASTLASGSVVSTSPTSADSESASCAPVKECAELRWQRVTATRSGWVLHPEGLALLHQSSNSY